MCKGAFLLAETGLLNGKSCATHWTAHELFTQRYPQVNLIPEKIISEGEAGVENYKNLLRAGGSNYPYLLLREAGVDMATPEPYQAIGAKMNEVMDEMERLLDEKEQ